MRNLIIFPAFFLCMVSCALHPPISEQIIFSNNEYKGDNFKFAEVSSGFSTSIYSSSFKKKAKAKYATEHDSTLNSIWQSGGSFYGLAYNIGDKFSIGVSPGAIVIASGLDGTVKLSDKNYITVSGNPHGNYEAIFQYRIFFNGQDGFSLGAFYRHENFEYGNHMLSYSRDLADMDILGIRGLFSLKSDNLKIRGIAGLGKEMEFDTFVFIAGITFKFISSKQKEKENDPDIYDF